MPDKWREYPVTTNEEIIQCIDAFCIEWGDYIEGAFPDSSFGHIVLSDYNLFDGNIEFCLEQHRVDEWVERIVYESGGDRFRVEIMRDAIMEFLGYLKNIPEDVRVGEDGDA